MLKAPPHTFEIRQGFDDRVAFDTHLQRNRNGG